MPKKVKDIKLMLNMIEGTILQLEKRREELYKEGDPETGVLPLRVRKELGWVEQNLRTIRVMKKEAEETLKQTKDEEERKKIVNVMALAMLVGAVNENLRIISIDRSQKEVSDKVFFDSLVEAIFASGDYRFISDEDVKDILQDEELRKMAEEDPGKLLREEMDYKAEYEQVIKKAIGNVGIATGDDFEENEAKFRIYLKENNGFEAILKRNGDFINNNILPKDSGIGTAEDKKHFREVMEEIMTLGCITRKLQEQYIKEEDSFEKGNGYTKELVDRERALGDRLEAYSEKLLNEIMKLKPEDKRYKECTTMYEVSQMMVTPVRNQQRRDYVLQKNNDLRCRLERWNVYQQLPGDDRPEILRETVEMKNRKYAIAKLRRIERMAIRRGFAEDYEMSDAEMNKVKASLREGKGDIRSGASTWAVEETQNLLEFIDSDEPLTGEAIPEVRKHIAALVLYQLLIDDIERKDNGPRYYYDRLKGGLTQERFLSAAGELSETEEFRKAVDPLIKGDQITESVYRFLANDFEKGVARKIYAAVDVKKKKEKKEKKEKKSGSPKAADSVKKGLKAHKKGHTT